MLCRVSLNAMLCKFTINSSFLKLTTSSAYVHNIISQKNRASCKRYDYSSLDLTDDPLGLLKNCNKMLTYNLEHNKKELTIARSKLDDSKKELAQKEKEYNQLKEKINALTVSKVVDSYKERIVSTQAIIALFSCVIRQLEQFHHNADRLENNEKLNDIKQFLEKCNHEIENQKQALVIMQSEYCNIAFDKPISIEKTDQSE